MAEGLPRAKNLSLPLRLSLEILGICIPSPKQPALFVVKWSRPFRGWVKVNVDGSSRGNPGPSGGGGLGRDSNGNFLFAFKLGYGRGFNTRAELRAILNGIELCAQMGYSRVEIASDSSMVVVSLAKELPPISSLYVGDLDPFISDSDLIKSFFAVGLIVSVCVYRDSISKASLGYGYVNFLSPSDGKILLSGLAGLLFGLGLLRSLQSVVQPSAAVLL
ncbi:uncharacterized protein LOC131217411 [Magnolia sinica]|uniref:uncharacterized protein LOC131217411 n=1 Tax=Magnolia sinica TaxID=86752 RepID=UPI0026582D2C|nr:uncharacterized protein LOC131217411 [Magnolia sinica]